MQAHKIPVFKMWVSEWGARFVIFSILMTCLYSFALYTSPATIMGFYGVESTDIQYAMVVIYGSTVAFLALDFRIVKYFAPRKYLLTALAVNAGCSLMCFYTRSWPVFMIVQFIQGITCALMSGIVLNMIFPRLESARARIIGYTILYGGIQTSVPLYSIYYSIVLYFFDFNWLFYGLNVLLIVLAGMVLVTMNGKARFHKKLPLYQVDWAGYLFYITFILISGYILVYGRQLGWFDSPLLIFLILFNMLILLIFIKRSLRLKRPLINLYIFKAKKFAIGLLLLVVFYIFKGSTGLAYGYLEVILGNDMLSTIPIWTAVIAGTVIGMFVISRFVLMGYNLIRMIIAGFGIMALFYIYMLLYVSVQGETIYFIPALFIYGLATGVLFVPIVTFTTSAAPPQIAVNASLVGTFARFTGFTASMAINNELHLYTKAGVREKIRETLIETNPQFSVSLQNVYQTYLNAGNDSYAAMNSSAGYIDNLVKEQIVARATRDYYDLMLLGVLCVIVILLLLPQIQNVVLKLKKGQVPY
ncbi:MFS transporter (plasmid) [Chryseobacterium panacisoli]|uniref:MFS transporter n=2 Tax=Chryseobacterium panacisoli TaxID=1807141 RepID=A0A5D8ZZW2_9FLAO|nr:MFS transporter [Chryseobacterium panacisoli]